MKLCGAQPSGGCLGRYPESFLPEAATSGRSFSLWEEYGILGPKGSQDQDGGSCDSQLRSLAQVKEALIPKAKGILRQQFLA